MRTALGRQKLIRFGPTWSLVKFLDTRVRIQHSCPFCDFSAAFPEAEMVLWCNGSNEVLQITVPEPSVLEDTLKEARKSLNARDIIQDGRSALTVLRVCRCRQYRSVMTIADESDVWLVPPVIYGGGWETHRVLSQGRTSLRRFVEEVKKSGKAEIVSNRPREHLDVIHDLSVVPVHFFEGLTDRQVHALVSAYEHGLLEIPAKARMERLAKKERISRSTYGEHLRKAQLQLLRNSYPFPKLRDVGMRLE